MVKDNQAAHFLKSAPFLLALAACLTSAEVLAESKAVVKAPMTNSQASARIEAEVDNLLTLAANLYNKNQFTKCIDVCNRIIILSPREGEAYRMRGISNQKSEKYTEAINDLTKAMAIQGDKVNEEVWIGRGDCFLTVDRETDAMKDFNTCVRLHPNFSGGYLRRAQLNCGNKHYDEAIKDADKLVQLRPKDNWAFQTRAMILAEAGHTKGAIDDYTQMIKLSPLNDSAYMSRSRAYEKLGKFELAAKDKEKAREIAKRMLE